MSTATTWRHTDAIGMALFAQCEALGLVANCGRVVMHLAARVDKLTLLVRSFTRSELRRRLSIGDTALRSAIRELKAASLIDELAPGMWLLMPVETPLREVTNPGRTYLSDANQKVAEKRRNLSEKRQAASEKRQQVSEKRCRKSDTTLSEKRQAPVGKATPSPYIGPDLLPDLFPDSQTAEPEFLDDAEIDSIISAKNVRLCEECDDVSKIGRRIADELNAQGVSRKGRGGVAKEWDRASVMRRLDAIIKPSVNEVVAFWAQAREQAGLGEDMGATTDGRKRVRSLLMSRCDSAERLATAVEGIKKALTNGLQDVWLTEKGKRTLAWICRSATQVQELRDAAPKPANSGAPNIASGYGVGQPRFNVIRDIRPGGWGSAS